MTTGDDSSFYLYGVGEKPQALTLGSLVLEKYWQPLTARHYTHEMLRDEELHRHAHVSDLTQVVFHGRSRLSPSLGVSNGGIIDLSLAWNKDLERIVVAEKGTRVILKDPETFLTTSVLSNPIAQQKLKLWLSAARSDYVLNFKFARRPKIWLITGIYLLEGTRTMVTRDHSANGSVGISPTIIGAISGVPIGGSVGLGQKNSWELSMEVAEKHVWAAQFRLLDAKFVKMGKGGVEDAKLPISMGLYRDLLSVNTVRGAGQDGVELGLEESTNETTEGDTVNDQDSQALKEYAKRLEDAIKVFEKAPKHILE